MKTYMGREVAKEVIAIGIGGQIDRDGQPEMPPKSVVTIKTKAVMDSVKHKFLDDGTVQEITTLVIDRATFEVLDVSEPPEDAQLTLGDEPPDPDAPAGIEAAGGPEGSAPIPIAGRKQGAK